MTREEYQRELHGQPKKSRTERYIDYASVVLIIVAVATIAYQLRRFF